MTGQSKDSRARLERQGELRTRIFDAMAEGQFGPDEFIVRAYRTSDLDGLRWFKDRNHQARTEGPGTGRPIGFDQARSSFLRFLGGGNLNSWVEALFSKTAESYGLKTGEQPTLAADPEPTYSPPLPHHPTFPPTMPPTMTSATAKTGEEIRKERNRIIEWVIGNVPLGQLPDDVAAAVISYRREHGVS